MSARPVPSRRRILHKIDPLSCRQDLRRGEGNLPDNGPRSYSRCRNTKQHMQEFYKDIKTRLVNNGRAENECAILPAIDVVIGETESIAKERAEAINSYASAPLGVAEISNALGMDMSNTPLDSRLEDMELTQGCRGILDVMLQGVKSANLTLGEAGKAWRSTK